MRRELKKLKRRKWWALQVSHRLPKKHWTGGLKKRRRRRISPVD